MNYPVYIIYFSCYYCPNNNWKIYRNYLQETCRCDNCKGISNYDNYDVIEGPSDERCYGKFRCENERCRFFYDYGVPNEWTSGYTWILYHQKCSYCNKKTYPYTLHQLSDASGNGCEGDGEDKYHKRDLCGICIEIRGDCQYDYYYY